jgi:hypothetical protein
VEANSTGGQGSRRAVARSDDHDCLLHEKFAYRTNSVLYCHSSTSRQKLSTELHEISLCKTVLDKRKDTAVPVRICARESKAMLILC